MATSGCAWWETLGVAVVAAAQGGERVTANSQMVAANSQMVAANLVAGAPNLEQPSAPKVPDLMRADMAASHCKKQGSPQATSKVQQRGEREIQRARSEKESGVESGVEDQVVVGGC